MGGWAVMRLAETMPPTLDKLWANIEYIAADGQPRFRSIVAKKILNRF